MMDIKTRLYDIMVDEVSSYCFESYEAWNEFKRALIEKNKYLLNSDYERTNGEVIFNGVRLTYIKSVVIPGCETQRTYMWDPTFLAEV